MVQPKGELELELELGQVLCTRVTLPKGTGSQTNKKKRQKRKKTNRNWRICRGCGERRLVD